MISSTSGSFPKLTSFSSHLSNKTAALCLSCVSPGSEVNHEVPSEEKPIKRGPHPVSFRSSRIISFPLSLLWVAFQCLHTVIFVFCLGLIIVIGKIINLIQPTSPLHKWELDNYVFIKKIFRINYKDEEINLTSSINICVLMNLFLFDT